MKVCWWFVFLYRREEVGFVLPVSLFVFGVPGREIDTQRIIGMVWNCDDMMWFVIVGLKEGMFHVHFRVVGLLTIRSTMKNCGLQVGLKEGMFYVHFRVVGLLTIRFTMV